MKTYKEEPKKVGAICAFLVLVCGGLTIGGGITMIYQPLLFMRQAEPVDGAVDSTAFEDRSMGEPGKDEYRPAIIYRYSYEGESFTNSNLTPHSNDGYVNEFEAQRVLSHHPLGTEVTVYVDPEAPSRSFLLREPLGCGPPALCLSRCS